MSQLTVRRLHIDLGLPLPRHWCGGDAFRTAFFNALSMSFPRGEQFFIDAVKRGVATLPADKRAALESEVKGFIGQEATHRRIHSLFNGHLEKQGLVNHWQARADRRLSLTADADPRHDLGITAATEHLTAILSEWGLAHPHWLHSEDARINTMWLWHFSEEIEHKSTAIDVYLALGGNDQWRVRYYRLITKTFLHELARQTINNLWHDGTWWRPSTWASASRFLFGRDGLVRALRGPWKDYLMPGFHPHQMHNEHASRWLQENQHAYSPVSPSPV
jgi:predicted metal-dependent hydrolase